ncbi:MAG: DUF2948 family protein [Alphaproteobacteria bacterium]|nr:DUF2948 family protein [Alphaproteobacteria bacterium]
MTPELLKLRAEDAEDIEVVSAVLQDAIVPFCDIAFQEEDNVFVFVAQRLCREEKEGTERICCAMTIKGVKSVRTHGISSGSKDELMLDLLAIILEPENVLNFIFAGDSRIRLELDKKWHGIIEDFGERWPALCQPRHDANT